jgi:hypothetical protein
MVIVAALRVVGGVRVLLGRHALGPGAVDLPASGIAARASRVGRLVVLVLEARVAVVFVGLNGLLPPGWQLGCVHAGGLSPKGGMMEWEGRDGMRSGFGRFWLGTGGAGRNQARTGSVGAWTRRKRRLKPSHRCKGSRFRVAPWRQCGRARGVCALPRGRQEASGRCLNEGGPTAVVRWNLFPAISGQGR